MTKRTVFFLTGVLLFLGSLPLSSIMLWEKIHVQTMHTRYLIENINTGYPASPTTFRFDDQTIEIAEVLHEMTSYNDPWAFTIKTGDLSFKVDGEVIQTLHHVPIRIEETGLNRYHGSLAYLNVTDQKEGETFFALLMKKTRENPKVAQNGDILGSVQAEDLSYELIKVDKNGNQTTEFFTFTNRNALQTILMNQGDVTPYSVGYYTNAWHMFPAFFFPLSYPFGTLLVGFLLMCFFYPQRKIT